MKKNKILILYLLAIAIISIVIGISYAFFKIRQEDLSKNIQVTGTDLQISFTGQQVLNLNNAEPIYEEEYLDTNNYLEFTVETDKNNTVSGCYELKIKIDAISNTLKNEYFKWVLYNVNDSVEETSGNFSTITNNYISMINSKNLSLTTKDKYRLYVFIAVDENADQSNMLGTSFGATIEGKASAGTC